MGLSSAKESEVAYLQNDAWKKSGIGDFLKGKYKPGLGGPGAGKVHNHERSSACERRVHVERRGVMLLNSGVETLGDLVEIERRQVSAPARR